MNTVFDCLSELPVKWLKELEPETTCMKGQPMYLTCELNKERDVTWKHNNTKVKNKAGKVAINIIGLQHAVTIQNATDDDAGTYSCEVDEQEDIKTITNVKVMGKQVAATLGDQQWKTTQKVNSFLPTQTFIQTESWSQTFPNWLIRFQLHDFKEN